LKTRYIRSLCAALLLASPATLAFDYGTTGAIDTPTARMQDDSTFSSTIAYDGLTQSYALTYQLTPWAEGTFRYTGFEDFFHWDRNYEAKIRLIEESNNFPQLSIGIRDMFGTGVFGSEYIVASKSIGRVDATLGLGWGRLAGKQSIGNPLKLVHHSFATRTAQTGVGGTLSSGDFFSGEGVGLFGSLIYSLDSLPMSLIAEYNPDPYAWEVSRGAESPASPFSAGLNWDISPNISLGLSLQNGDRVGLRFTARNSTSNSPLPYQPAPFVKPESELDLRNPDGSSFDPWFVKLRDEARIGGVDVRAAKLNKEQSLAQVEVIRGGHRSWPDAIEEAHNAASVSLPSTVKRVLYVTNEQGHLPNTITLPILGAATGQGLARSMERMSILPGRSIESATNEIQAADEELTFALDLSNKIILFDPNNPLGYQFYLNLSTGYRLTDSVTLRGSFAVDLLNNFDGNDRPSDSVLPHVRSDAARYLSEGASGLDSLYLDKRGSVNKYIHYRTYAGVLEQMYSGVGAEALYQPYQSRMAFGLSGNWVKQRDYNASFDHLDYDTITAFGSLYWATPFYNYDAALHVGRYLAKDVGGTFELRRTFDNGWMVGMWATITDVPFDTFGEGSFDKGIFIQVPFETLFGGGPAANYKTVVRPILRDGGARLEQFSGTIWWDLRGARYDVFAE